MNINTSFLKSPLVWLAALGGLAALIWVVFKQLRDTVKSGEETITSAPGDLIKKTLVSTAEGVKEAGKTIIGGVKNLFSGDKTASTSTPPATTTPDYYATEDEYYDPNQYVF